MEKQNTAEFLPHLLQSSICFPPGISLLGSRLSYLDERILELNRLKHLSLGNLLDQTPSRWVYCDWFQIASTMVSNGEYLQFLHDREPDPFTGGDGERLYDGHEMWRYLWTDLKYGIEVANAQVQRPDGSIMVTEENYRRIDNFVEAYLESLKFEIDRHLMVLEEGASEDGDSDLYVVQRPETDTGIITARKDRNVQNLFLYLKYALRDAICNPEQQEEKLFTDREKLTLSNYLATENRGETILNDVDQLLLKLRRIFGHVERSNPKSFVEPISFLERVKRQLRRQTDPLAPIPLHTVLYPRAWSNPQGEGQARGFVGPNVPWLQRPVTGITLYEALGYCTWLSTKIGWEYSVTLLNEAEYERAAGWPRDVVDERPPEVMVDGRMKDIFPWQRTTEHDFNYFFGREGQELETLYSNKRRYQQVLESTARIVSNTEKLYMLLGFGWQWTQDRFNENERKYNRFQDIDYRRYTDKVYKDVDRTDQALEVFLYESNKNQKNSYFVARGAPDIIGGPGLTTRRFALYPMRGYHNVGFRWVLKKN